jgi:hypothetical protein
MNEAVDFFQRFIRAEYEMAEAAYGERDSSLYAKKLEAFEGFLKGVRTPDSRVRGIDDLELGILGEDWFETGQQVLEQLRPRTLFQVKQYLHPELGDVFRAYVSDSRAFIVDVYGANLYAARVEGELRIISLYATCDECLMTGKVDGRTCPECKGTGWRFLDGSRLDDPGKLVEVRKLQPPSSRQQREEYEAELDLPRLRGQ